MASGRAESGRAASGGVENESWQQIEDEITCCICGDLFTDPKTIPCLHTFCKRCIEKIMKSNKMAVVCCPLCRAPLSRDKVPTIPTNFLINRLVEIYKKRLIATREGSVETNCDNCEVNVAITWCIECDGSLCRNCNEAHKKLKLSRWHKTVSIKAFFQDPKLTLSTLEKAEFCKIHTKQTLDLFCKTCCSLICRDCTLKDHPREKHDFDFIENVVGKEREKTKHATALLKQLLEQMRNGIKNIEHCEKQVDMETAANIKKIRATYGEVYKLLKKQEEETVEKVLTMKTSFKKRLALQKESGHLIEGHLVSCDEFCKKIMTANRTRQLLMYNKWIVGRVEELKKQVEYTSRDPECKANNMIVNYRKPVEIVNDSLCDVFCMPICSCSQYGQIIRPDQIKVIILLEDIVESPVVNQSKDLEICANKERGFIHNTHIEEGPKGQYHIWYNRKRNEEHSLTVYWKGFALNHEKIRVSMNIRDYATIKQEVKVIKKADYKSLEDPYVLAKGPNSELIVRNDSKNQLAVFDKHFQFSHVIGGVNSTGHRKFHSVDITGIAVDKKGYVFVAACELGCIQKFKLSGEFIAQFGSKGTADGQLKWPCGLVVSQSEMLFVCDNGNHRIQVFENERFSYRFGQCGLKSGTFNEPKDLTLNNNEDQLFVTDHKNSRVQVFTITGQFLKIFGDFTGVPFKLQHPIGIHYTPDGHLLISSCDTNCVLVFKEDGKFISAIEGTYQGKERFCHPCGVVMMDNGEIIIAAGSDGNKLVVF
ncbi:E3 ubiquitin-protein ligase TRIM71-like [Dysidea avara]|uniref:E3 ubiquitin-protein ligase TRIM71-like n=1 Tax=Dysidea avara TaxID=196820 RepID=UPI0033306647